MGILFEQFTIKKIQYVSIFDFLRHKKIHKNHESLFTFSNIWIFVPKKEKMKITKSWKFVYILDFPLQFDEFVFTKYPKF